MPKFSNQLTDAERERLDILTEELGETLKEIGKVCRHGYESGNPDLKEFTTNRVNLEKELGDVLHAIDRMIKAGDISHGHIDHRRIIKANKIVPYLHHQ